MTRASLTRTAARYAIASAAVALTWSTAVPGAVAQTSASKPDEIDLTGGVELTRGAIQVRRQAVVTVAMDLEPKEAEAFWPLYREYRLAIMTVNDRMVKLLTDFLERDAALTDEAATKLIDEHINIERDRTGVKASFVPRFNAVLPPRKVARFFQVEHKLDAIISAELAELVPLVK
jgi:hypothetical protein